MNLLKDSSPIQTLTAQNILAAVGFLALVAVGVGFAAYATRFVPVAVNSIGSAAVSLGSLFTPAPEPTLLTSSPLAATSSPDEEVSTPVATSTPLSVLPISHPAPFAPIAGPEASTILPISGATTTPTLSGLADLTTTITAIGYLATSSTDSFIATSTVPAGSRPAVRFTIQNVGTNISGPWRFSASLPAQVAYIYQSALQQSLAPGDRIEYTLGFDRANRGTNQTISITANFDHTVPESNTNNNSASAALTIFGS